MARRTRKSIAAWKRPKRKKRRVQLSEEQWNKIDFNFPQFLRWSHNFRLIFTSNPEWEGMMRKRLEKHGYSFEKLEQERPELVENVLSLIELWERDMQKGINIAEIKVPILRDDKATVEKFDAKKIKSTIDFKAGIAPMLHELYKILRAKGFNNQEICGSVRPEERYVVK